MMSDFFNLSTEQQIKSFTKSAVILLKNYGVEDAEIKCINFEFNATFCVVTQSGQKFALRININSTRSPENMRAEVEWVNSLSRTPGINVPRPIANGSDQFISSLFHEDSGRTLNSILFTWLEGEELGDEASADQMFTVGAAMATLHQSSQTFTLTPPAELAVFDDWLWGTEDYLLSDKSQLTDAQQLIIRDAVQIIESDTSALYNTTPIQIIHGDLHGWNLMWHEGVLSIFDFDDCGFGIPQQDLAVCLYYLDTPEQKEALLSGYQSIQLLPAYTQSQMASLLLQRRLVLLNYLYETSNPEHRAMLPVYLEKTMERIAGFLTDVRG
jgi:Ser/Thr protein kinase RdoA (MazF antagonist)